MLISQGQNGDVGPSITRAALYRGGLLARISIKFFSAARPALTVLAGEILARGPLLSESTL